MMTGDDLRKPPSDPAGIKRVQVGCGPHNILPDWWNVDIRRFKGIDEVMDVTEPWPWKDALDYVYGEHFLEHLTIDQAVRFLLEAGNALVVGGKIRLSTPALEWVLKTHFTFEVQEQKVIQQTWAINRAFKGWGHQFLYSKAMFVRLLESVGFRDARFYEYGHSDDGNLANLERHGGWKIFDGFPSVWIVEATRLEYPIELSVEFMDELNANFSRYVESGH